MTSIRWRLLAWLVPGQAAVLFVLNVAIWSYASEVIVGAFDERLATSVRAIGALLSQEGPDFELEFSDELMPQFVPSPSPEYFEVWVEGTGVLERSRSLLREEGTNNERVLDLPRQGGTVKKPLAWDLQLPDGVAGRAVGISFPVHEYSPTNAAGQTTPRAKAVVVVAVNRAPLDQNLTELRVLLVALDVILLVVSALLLLVGVHMGLLPMLKMADSLETASTSEEALELSWAEVPGELMPVKAAMRGLLERVDAAYQREKRLASNIAHELRTPIAELRAAAEVALMSKRSRSALEKAVHTSHDIAREMEAVVLTILRIWRSRSTEANEEATLLDPFALLEEALYSVETSVAERSLITRVVGDPSLRVLAPVQVLTLAVDNLIRNAAQHAVEGSRIECSVDQEGERVVLTVRNWQSNLTGADEALVREPFWSRSESGREAEHSGLGLALVDALAEASGIELNLAIEAGDQESGEAGVFTARLVVPGQPGPA